MANNVPPQALGPVDRGAHTPSAILVRVEPLKNGGYRLSTPHARGWAAVATTPLRLAHSMAAAFIEVQVSAYARAHGKVYDLDNMTMQVQGDPLAGLPMSREARPRSGRRRRSHNPADWQMTDNGSWRSPGGRVYQAGSQVVQRVVQNRAALGLPVS